MPPSLERSYLRQEQDLLGENLGVQGGGISLHGSQVSLIIIPGGMGNRGQGWGVGAGSVWPSSGLGRSLDFSPSMSLSSPKFRILKGPVAKSPALLALKSPPDLWRVQRLPREYQAAWVKPFLGQDTRAGTGNRSRGCQEVSPFPPRSFCALLMASSHLPSFLSFQAAPSQRSDQL